MAGRLSCHGVWHDQSPYGLVMKAPHPVPPLITAWLRNRDQTDLVDSGMHTLSIFLIASNMAGPDGLPAPVLEEWAYMVRVERLMRAQCVPRLLTQLRQAGFADTAINDAIGLDPSLSLDENAQLVEQEHQRARQHHIDMSPHYAGVLGADRVAREQARPE